MLGNPGLSTDYYGKVLEAEPKNKQVAEELEAVRKVQRLLEMANREMEKLEYRTVGRHTNLIYVWLPGKEVNLTFLPSLVLSCGFCTCRAHESTCAFMCS